LAERDIWGKDNRGGHEGGWEFLTVIVFRFSLLSLVGRGIAGTVDLYFFVEMEYLAECCDVLGGNCYLDGCAWIGSVACSC